MSVQVTIHEFSDGFFYTTYINSAILRENVFNEPV